MAKSNDQKAQKENKEKNVGGRGTQNKLRKKKIELLYLVDKQTTTRCENTSLNHKNQKSGRVDLSIMLSTGHKLMSMGITGCSNTLLLLSLFVRVFIFSMA